MSLIFDLIEYDLALGPISSEEVTTPGPGSYDTTHDAQPSVEEWKQRPEDNGSMFALQYWAEHIQYALSHREKPIELFDTEIVEKKGIKAHVAKKK